MKPLLTLQPCGGVRGARHADFIGAGSFPDQFAHGAMRQFVHFIRDQARVTLGGRATANAASTMTPGKLFFDSQIRFMAPP